MKSTTPVRTYPLGERVRRSCRAPSLINTWPWSEEGWRALSMLLPWRAIILCVPHAIFMLFTCSTACLLLLNLYRAPPSTRCFEKT